MRERVRERVAVILRVVRRRGLRVVRRRGILAGARFKNGLGSAAAQKRRRVSAAAVLEGVGADDGLPVDVGERRKDVSPIGFAGPNGFLALEVDVEEDAAVFETYTNLCALHV